MAEEEYTPEPYTFEYCPYYSLELEKLYRMQHTQPSTNHTILVFNKIAVNDLVDLLSYTDSLYDAKLPCFGTARYQAETTMYIDRSYGYKYNAICHVSQILLSNWGKQFLTKSCRDNKFIRLPDYKYFFEKFSNVGASQHVSDEERKKLLDELAIATFSCVTDKQNNLSTLYDKLSDQDKKLIEKEMAKVNTDGKNNNP